MKFDLSKSLISRLQFPDWSARGKPDRPDFYVELWEKCSTLHLVVG